MGKILSTQISLTGSILIHMQLPNIPTANFKTATWKLDSIYGPSLKINKACGHLFW